MVRIGQGWDRHRLVADRPFILGGVTFPEAELGLLGHSDADALCHAITDALLGAAALGDIGQHFPDTDPRFAGADSIVLLQKAWNLVAGAGFQLGNIDATVICEQPKIAPRSLEIRQNLARALDLPLDCISLKATRGEGLGPEGRGECLTAQAIVLLEKS
jgi:2-C-methyl-D-erythritol 2,4-cyclodiphosphate synthase